MAKLSRKKGTTSQIFTIFIQDSSSTTGAGLTGLVFNSASLACKYKNEGGTLSGAITLQDITTLGTYEAPTANTNMRFKELNSASPSQGMYEIHVHNDWMNLTGGSFVIMLAGATNMAQTRLEIDLQTDVNVTHLLGTAWLTPAVAGTPDVNSKQVGGTAQTGRDLGATLGVAGAGLTDLGGMSTTMKAQVETEVDDALGGGTGTALTAIPWNASWDVEVQSEVDDALVVQRLDELLNADSDIDGVAPPTVGSVFHELLSKTAGSFTYDQTTDSLEAIRDKETDIETDTADIQTRIPAALVSGRMDSSVGSNLDKTGYALTTAPPTAIENADALLDRNMATGTDSGSPTVRTVRQALRFLRNKWSISGTTLTVTKEDDTTASFTATVTTDAAAVPIVGNDPA